MSKRARKSVEPPPDRILFPVPKDIVEKLIEICAATPEPKCGCCTSHTLKKTLECVGCNRVNYICSTCDGYTVKDYACACCTGYLCENCLKGEGGSSYCDVFTVENDKESKCHNRVRYCKGCKEKLRQCEHCDERIYLCRPKWHHIPAHFINIADYELWMNSHEIECGAGRTYRPKVERKVTLTKL